MMTDEPRTEELAARDWIDDLLGITHVQGVRFGELMVPVSAIRRHYLAFMRSEEKAREDDLKPRTAFRAASRPAVQDGLREALEKYGAHLAECSCRPHIRGYLNRPCDCGLRAALADKGSPAVGSAQPFRVTDDDLDAPDGTEMMFRRVRGSWEPITRSAVGDGLREALDDAMAFGHNLAVSGKGGLGHAGERYQDCPQPLCLHVTAALADKGSRDGGCHCSCYGCLAASHNQ